MNFHLTTILANFADHKMLGDAKNSGQLSESISASPPTLLFYRSLSNSIQTENMQEVTLEAFYSVPLHYPLKDA